LQIIVLFATLNCSFLAHAAINSSHIAHNQCIRAIYHYEKKYSLPSNMLYSIAVVESGYSASGKGPAYPWPWTINTKGKSYYCSTKSQALRLLKKFIAAGISNIDVGCAQINWRYHKKAFHGKPENILNPVYNVAYAAHMLHSKYSNNNNDWALSVASYHSGKSSLGRKYAAKVFDTWRDLRNKRRPSSYN